MQDSSDPLTYLLQPTSRRKQEGRTALFLISSGGDDDAACALLAHAFLRRGADLLTRDLRGQTVLHQAARNGGVRLAAALLEAGAAPIDATDAVRTPQQHGMVPQQCAFVLC